MRNSGFKIVMVISFMLLLAFKMNAQNTTINANLLEGYWPAYWVGCPDVPPRDYGVFHFRKSFNLTNKPAKFIIHLTADNRYRFFVNGKAVCSGPARGDLAHWNFETIDIAPLLNRGDNTLAVLVWNMGTLAPVAQISNQTGLLVQGDTENEQLVNTNNTWKVMASKAYSACSTDNMQRLKAYMVIGPGDKVDATLYPWGWEQNDYNDGHWQQALPITRGVPFGYGTDNLWTLVPRSIPMMEESIQRIPVVRRSSGIRITNAFLKGKSKLSIPANSTISILLDQTHNTVAYPELLTTGGKGSTIKLTYAEALFDAKGQKGNRNDIDGKSIKGNYDIFEPDGGANRLFRPLWFRTFRYLQLDITTEGDELQINDLYGIYTGYPFQKRATFSCNDASMDSLWNTGWRTARLCAGETYFDCPYYEQLQYEGDTRIQALISLYVTADDRLMRKAITDFSNSRIAEGLTQGRYPSNRLQVIPPYSLFWVSMIHDYWMLRSDEQFVEQYLSPIRGVLEWYEKHIDKSKNMLGAMEWWSFTDYSEAFNNEGVPEGILKGNSSIITLQYCYTLQQAAQMFRYFGHHHEADHYGQLAEQLKTGTYDHCFSKTTNLMANTPDKSSFSQHAGIMAILSSAIPQNEEKEVMNQLLNNKSIAQATFYYRFYLDQALKKVGMANLYVAQLKPWRNMLGMGLSTFAEKPEPARSDCHAWSASPCYDFLATICGITPDAPGFKTICIAPAFGELKEIKASMPHPKGWVSMMLQRNGVAGIKGQVTLPAEVAGRFIWEGKEIELHGGTQKIKL